MNWRNGILYEFLVSSCLYVNGIRIFQFKVKDCKLNVYPVRLGIILKDFEDNKMKQAGLNGYVYDFSVDYGSVDVNDILDIHKYLVKKNNIK